MATPARHGRRERVAWALLGAAMVGLAILAVPAMLYLRRAEPQPVVTRLEVVTPPSSDPFSFAISPDGRQLAFVASAEGGSRLWLRSFDQDTARPLTGTEGASYPFWSPDTRAIGFFTADKLKRIDLTGGASQVLADVPGARGGTWSRDGVIVFAPQQSVLMQVAATGGTPTALTELAPGEGSHRWPQFLPDGRRFLFYVGLGQPSTHGVYVGSLDGRQPTRLLAGEAAAVYAPPGLLLRVEQGALVAHPFDAERGVVSAQSVRLAQSVAEDDGTFRSAFSVSEAGVLAYRTSGLARRQIVWVDRTGKVTGVVRPPDDARVSSPELTRDGKRIAVHRGYMQGNVDVWLIDVATGVLTQFTFDAANDAGAVWAPDGKRIVFGSSRNGKYGLFEKPSNLAADERALPVTGQDTIPLDWSSDGAFLLYASQDPKTGSDLWALPLVGGSKPLPVVQTRFDERQGQFSADGRWVAYVSNESGSDEVYIQAFPGPGGKRLVSAAGGSDPRWRRDGQELFYVARDNKLMAVSIEIGADRSTLSPGAPVALFQTRFAIGANITLGWLSKPQYAVAPDGRFLMNVTVEDPAAPITIFQNWTTLLKQ
jgi:Tol biopolymer transport system component